MGKLTHLNKRGEAIMVDVSGKKKTERTAVAEAVVAMKKETLRSILKEGVKKGDVFGTARIAGIMAAKKTPELVPLCHPIFLESVTVDFSIDEKKNCIRVICTTKVEERTGVEMEAMTGVMVACLALYDMCKGIDKSIEIRSVRLLKKTGGKSGTFERRR